MYDVVIAGTGITAFGRWADRTVRDLAAEAVDEALHDAGATAEEIGLVAFANAADGLLAGQEMVLGQVALARHALAGVPVVNVENACASGSSAFHLALSAVRAGECDVALVVGAEKMVFPDKRGLVALSRALDVADLVHERGEQVLRDGAGALLMEVYAEDAVRYLQRTDAPRETFAVAAAKSHRNGSLNPKAQQRQAFSPSEVLDSRAICDPLTLLMCSPLSDGAAAVVVASARWARERGVEGVRVLASALRSGSFRPGSDPVAEAARAAFERGGVAPSDVDVVELHDAASSAEPLALEQLALAPDGGGWKLVLEGETALEGRLPVNPGGGLVARGHPVGATGCAQLVELSDQLRGRAGARQVRSPRIGLAENAGGILQRRPQIPAVCAVTLLAAPGEH